MRIMIVQPSLLYYGGAAAATAHLSAYLNSKGIKNTVVTLVATSDFITSCPLDIDIKTKTIASSYDFASQKKAIYTRFNHFFSDTLTLRRFIAKQKNDYDLINPHNFPANWSSILHKKPIVWMMNEPLGIYTTTSFLPEAMSKIAAKVDHFLVRNCIDQICVNSYITYKQAKQIYNREAKIVFFGVDYSRYCSGSRDKAIERFGLEEHFVILTSGVLDPWKNQLASIKAVEKVRALARYIPDLKLVLAGGGDRRYMDMLRKYVQSRNLESYVIFTGFLPKKEITNLYHASHLGLYPSKEQGGLLAPFEQLCAGKPIIISPNNGASALIKKYRLGVVTDDYANAIINVHNNYNYFRNMAERAREIVKNEFSWEKYGERMLKVFEKCYITFPSRRVMNRKKKV